MTSSPAHRLESWRAVLRNGGPDWIVAHAPGIIAELEAGVAAQGIEAGTAGTTEIGPVHESLTAKPMRPKTPQLWRLDHE